MTTKRILDFTTSLLGLLFLLPVLLVIALLTKLSMPGPVLFRQYRVGQHGKLFKIVKFRSMKLHHHGSTVSIKGESRITPWGSVMRKYKLDELPELWNVIIGDMSLVGPRPHVPGYTDKLTGKDRIILTLRPGITGLASLKYSKEEELLALQKDPITYHKKIIFPDKVRINIHYIQNWSLGLDFKIIIFTILGQSIHEHTHVRVKKQMESVMGKIIKNRIFIPRSIVTSERLTVNSRSGS